MRYTNLDRQYSSKDILKNVRNKPPIGTVFRGRVVDNADPSNTGRVKVDIPALYSGIRDSLDEIPWALPCFTVASYQSGSFIIPEVESYVWVLFENNDIFKPVWIGAMYTTQSPMTTFTGSTTAFAYQNNVPSVAVNPNQYVVLRTPNGNTINIDDDSDRVNISNSTGNALYLDDSETVLEHANGGSVTLVKNMVFMQCAKNPNNVCLLSDEESRLSRSEEEQLVMLDDSVNLFYKDSQFYIDKNKVLIKRADGDEISVGIGNIEIKSKRTVDIQATSAVVVTAPDIYLNGNVKISGDLIVGGSFDG